MQDAITGLVFFVVIGTTAYIAGVILVEIYTVLNEERSAAAKAKKGAGAKLGAAASTRNQGGGGGGADVEMAVSRGCSRRQGSQRSDRLGSPSQLRLCEQCDCTRYESASTRFLPPLLPPQPLSSKAATRVNVGVLSTQMNPLFISDGSSNGGGGGPGSPTGRAMGNQSIAAIAATIAAQADAPPPELWRVFKVGAGMQGQGK